MLHPVNDRFKVKVDKSQFDFKGQEDRGTETGIVVEIPEVLAYLSFHSFAFEQSIGDAELQQTLHNYYSQFLNKRIFWEELQDRGRRIKEGDDEYVYLQMTDVLAYADSVDDDASIVKQGGFSA